VLRDETATLGTSFSGSPPLVALGIMSDAGLTNGAFHAQIAAKGPTPGRSGLGGRSDAARKLERLTTS
jgi:hypothetical protein